MEPYSSRAEADRWLSIAVKLLAGRDFLGSKTFAIRARDSDPSLEFADRILAVADTLLASEKRINNQHDWYAILQLGRHANDPELIATQYRRLALLLNPTRNKLAFVDEALKLVSDAWSVLSNPSKKSLYDNELNLFSKLDPAATIGSSRGQERHERQDHFTQQQQRTVRRSLRKSNVNNREKVITEDSEVHHTPDGNSNFWTACPYCYNMYEYPRVYEDCTLRCQNCSRAFHAVMIPSPPPISEGKEAYFCCWGFFPLGISISNWEKNKDEASNWAPFSPMFTCPQVGESRNVVEENVNVTAQKQKKVNARKSSTPRIYIDDEDTYVEISESSDDSDDEWGSTRRKKKAKDAKEKGSAGKTVKRAQVEKGKNVKGDNGENLQGGSTMQEGMRPPNMSNIEISKKAANSAKKQTRKVPKELGKLDLNVEFSNEVEEPVPGMSEGHGDGEEDGTGFFEGLDEFLNSLPILNVVGDDKVKAT